MSTNLDALLAAPLEEPIDMGFTTRVMMQVADLRLRRAKLEAALSLAALALVIVGAMLTPAGPALARVAEVLAGTPALWFAGVALLFSSVIYARVRA